MRRDLIVHPPPPPLPPLLRTATLCQTRNQPVLLQFMLAPGPREEAALVFYRLGLDQKGASQLCLDEQHAMGPYRVASALDEPWLRDRYKKSPTPTPILALLRD